MRNAFFVGLTPVGDPQLIAPAILAALNIPLLDTAEPRAQPIAHLREKHLLVLLDNFEHLLEGAELNSYASGQWSVASGRMLARRLTDN